MEYKNRVYKLLQDRYFVDKETTEEEMFQRVAKFISSKEQNKEKWQKIFYEMMISKRFIPNSPTLMNAGLPNAMMSACVVLDIDDSMKSIMETAKDAALLHKASAGTGFSFSNLRPKGSFVGNTKGVASGPVSFMTVYNAVTEAVKQGNRRRGANMGVLNVEHEDIKEFITCKTDLTKLTNFNISVAITDDFMSKIDTNPEKKEIFDMIIHNAWLNAEPGLLFIDTINKMHPINGTEIVASNPCGETILLGGEVCNLGSINISKFVLKDGSGIDYKQLEDYVKHSVRFLNNIIDLNQYPLEYLNEKTNKYRKIGLGVMAWADALIKMKIKYSSQEARDLAEKLMKFITETGRKASNDLAVEYNDYNDNRFELKSEFKELGKNRNATITAIAPTGTISMIAGCSSGIEPLFMTKYERITDDKKYFVYHPLCEELEKAGRTKEFEEFYEVSNDISVEDHILMQAAFQKYTDNSISKTINMPESATEDDIRKAYLLAYFENCKGITIYRNNSRTEQVISAVSTPEEDKPRERPEYTTGHTAKIKTGCGTMYVTVNWDSHGPCEVFVQIGKSGGCRSSFANALSRVISIALRANVPTEYIVKQLRGLQCPEPMLGSCKSCADGIGMAMEQLIKTKVFVQNDTARECPECDGLLVNEENCLTCKECGFSKCS